MTAAAITRGRAFPLALGLGSLVLAILAIEVLRRQTRLEFPNAHAGDASTEIKGWFGRGKGKRAGDSSATVVSEAAVKNGPEHAVAPVATPAGPGAVVAPAEAPAVATDAAPADTSGAATEVLEPTKPAE